ncbi:MAG TPA: dTDP-glucose 4,6-dehydratase [Candidatus Dojkabacteria bacterium]|jgi:dTDP-glucose 4,6-dehydratase
MKLFVTGGAGFIGSNFIRYWMKKYPEDKVINFDKLTYAGNLESLKEVEANPNYEFIKGDILDFDLVLEKTKGVDIIVHFAAESHVDRSIDVPFPFARTNVEGTLSLLEAARVNGKIRFHHISTDEVFGSLDLDSDEKFTEESPYDPRSPYSASKAGSDHMVRAYGETHELPITITNCSNNYGTFHFPEKFIPLAITRALAGEDIPLYGDGENIRDWIYVADHCQGIDLVIKKGRIGETYLLGGDSEVSNINVVESILDIIGASHDLIKFVEDRKGHDRRYAIDFSKAEKELGFKPEKSFDERLKETISWFKENKWWWEPLKKEADIIAQEYLKSAQ